jgi:hypothetical protein
MKMRNMESHHEPMGCASGNLPTTFETFNPFATPAAEIRIVPVVPKALGYVRNSLSSDFLAPGMVASGRRARRRRPPYRATLLPGAFYPAIRPRMHLAQIDRLVLPVKPAANVEQNALFRPVSQSLTQPNNAYRSRPSCNGQPHFKLSNCVSPKVQQHARGLAIPNV